MTILTRTCLLLLAFIGASDAADNAAQQKYGASITVTSAAAKPINARYNKPEDMLKSEKPAGPVINDLATARIEIGLTRKLHVKQVGVVLGDYKGTFGRVKEMVVEIGGKPVKTIAFDPASTKLQLFDVTADAGVLTDQVVLKVTAIEKSVDGRDIAYGTISQVQVMVDEDLATLFAAPTTTNTRPPMVMPTYNMGARPAVTVIGTPRKAEGYPRTIWDAQDIAELKQQIRDVPEAKAAFERMLTACNQLVARSVQVPELPDDGVDQALAAGHTKAVDAIANLGIGYALSGDERFAQDAKRMLLQLADRYEGWPVHGSPNFRHDKSKWSWQRLNDAIWLIQAAWGYDLIHASPSLTDADRAKISDHFIKPCVKQILSSQAIIAAPTNWSVICNAAVMIGARVAGDDVNYQLSINGLPQRAPKAKPGETPPAPKRKGGIYYHIDEGLDDDGMWGEGAIGYQFMAMRGLVVAAEILWHDGVDVWGYNNGRLKLMFDSPIWYMYPGGRSSPSIGDTGSSSLFGRDAHLYQYAKRRYGDRTYDAILARVTPSLASVYNLFLPAFDFRSVEPADLPPIPTTLFPGVGFGTVRTGEGDAARYLLLVHGPKRSHGHPDKLSHNLFALGQELFADGGSAWYSTDIYKRYYSHTLAHNTICANGQSQILSGGSLKAFCQDGDLALMRATADEAIPSTGLDRTLVMLGGRVYDWYRLRSGMPATFDLPYHSAGTLAPDSALGAALAPWTSDELKEDGYCYFSEPRIAAWDKDWSCAWTAKGGTMRMHSPGVAGTELIVATTPKGSQKLGTVMVRRKSGDTAFASVSDLIPTGAAPSVKSVRRLEGTGGGGLAAELVDGMTETVVVADADGLVTVGEWTTDASVAAIRMDKGGVSGLILAAGTTVRGPGVDLTLSAPGLVSCYRVGDDLARFTNHGASAVTVSWKGLSATSAVAVDAAGAWGARQAVAGGSFTVPASSAVDLVTGAGTQTVAQREAAQRAAQQKALWVAEQKLREQLAREAATRLEQAAKEPVPANYQVLLQAEAMTAQGGGGKKDDGTPVEVTVTEAKMGAFGKSITGWNNNGLWLEYASEVQHTGWYQVVIKYCLEGDSSTRVMLIDGKPLDPALSELDLPGTGGWSNGADQWSLFPVTLPGGETPLLVRLEAGKHVLRLENPAGGGLNLDYVALTPAGSPITRAQIER